MTILALKTYAQHQRQLVSETSGLRGLQLTRLLVQTWRDMDNKARLEWKLLAARQKRIKREATRVIKHVKNLLISQEAGRCYEEKLARARTIFTYLATIEGLRFLYHYPIFRQAVHNKLREFNRMGVRDTVEWASALHLTL